MPARLPLANSGRRALWLPMARGPKRDLGVERFGPWEEEVDPHSSQCAAAGRARVRRWGQRHLAPLAIRVVPHLLPRAGRAPQGRPGPRKVASATYDSSRHRGYIGRTLTWPGRTVTSPLSLTSGSASFNPRWPRAARATRFGLYKILFHTVVDAASQTIGGAT